MASPRQCAASGLEYRQLILHFLDWDSSFRSQLCYDLDLYAAGKAFVLPDRGRVPEGLRSDLQQTNPSRNTCHIAEKVVSRLNLLEGAPPRLPKAGHFAARLEKFLPRHWREEIEPIVASRHLSSLRASRTPDFLCAQQRKRATGIPHGPLGRDPLSTSLH